MQADVLRLAAALAATLLLASGCADAPAPDAAASGGLAGSAVAPPAVWTVSPDPILEIGVHEGEDPYQLHEVTSAARLPDGGVAVANAGSGEIRFYDGEGAFVRASGGRGEGPGEWMGPHRIRLTGAGTLLVVDDELGRIGRVSLDGAYLGASPLRDDVLFPSDQWIHGGFLVDSPLGPEERGPVARALDRVPAEPGVMRTARVTPGGRIWIGAWKSGDDAPVAWTVHDLEGRLLARVTTPPRFELHDQGENWVLGVVRDEMDVESVRVLPLDRGGDGYYEGELARVAATAGAAAPVFRRVPSKTLPDIGGAVRNLATAQEMYYSLRHRYSASLDTLSAYGRTGPLPEGVTFEPLRAGEDGWAGRLVQNGGREGCLLAYGSFRVVGVRNGTILCWQEATERADTN